MDEAVLMDLAERCRQGNGDAQETGQIERLPLVSLKNPIQGLTARILEYEYCPSFVTSERQRPGCPRGIEFGCERVFVLEPPETLRRRHFRGQCHRQNRRRIAMLPSAIKREVRAFPEEFQHVFRRRCHGGILIATAARPQNIPSGKGWEVNTNDVNGLEKEHRERSEETQAGGSVVLMSRREWDHRQFRQFGSTRHPLLPAVV
jgi:hypothetical protein